MVNPYEITNFHRNKFELEEFLLFCIVVAGKTAYIQAEKLEEFLTSNYAKFNFISVEPFNVVKCLYKNNSLLEELLKVKIGQYNKIYNALVYLCNNDLDLHRCTIEDLEKIPGVGPKTSRFFVLHSRKSELAILDTHILKFLRQFDANTPKTTPSNKKIYRKYELLFLEKCKVFGKTPSELDLELWKTYAKRKNNEN